MPLLLNGLTPLHWALAGVGIAGVTLALLVVGSRRLGISTGFEDVCSLVLRVPYLRRGAVTDGRPWRLPLLAGLVIGGFLSVSVERKEGVPTATFRHYSVDGKVLNEEVQPAK